VTSGQLKTEEIQQLLKDINVKLLLESPTQDYQFEYYTRTIRDPITDKIIRYIRTYKLNDLIRGNVTQEPWDTFDLDRQTGYVTNLLTNGTKLSPSVKSATRLFIESEEEGWLGIG